MSDALIAKIEELIAVTRAASLPVRERWLDAEGIAAMLSFKPRYVLENLSCRPDFPKPLRLAAPVAVRPVTLAARAGAMVTAPAGSVLEVPVALVAPACEPVAAPRSAHWSRRIRQPAAAASHSCP